MKLFICFIFLILFYDSSSNLLSNLNRLRSSWKPIDDHCESYVRVFAEAAANFTHCSSQNAVPPRICLSCAEEYDEFYKHFNRLKDDPYKSPFTGDTCGHEIFDLYELSTLYSIFDDLDSDIWKALRCDYCVEFLISPSKQHKRFDYSLNTKHFLESYENFTNCTDRFSERPSVEKINSSVCDFCWEYYENINEYYDKVFFHKSTEFCYDLQSMMNDTVRLWRSHFACVRPEYPRKSKDVLVVSILCSLVFGGCILFYALSFLVGTRRKRTLKRYQRAGTNQSAAVINSNEQLFAPRVEHSALLSEAARPRRVISYSVLPPSMLG